jgi:ABC-type Mn2+/Zn2+ transport system ATPase subunit
MDRKLVFNKIKKDTIFCEDFNNFELHNEIEFSKDGIAVVYGPNGTGKTSLARVLNGEEKCSFKVKFESKELTEKDKELFHIINDQNSRNIIEGDTEDFLLGDDIKKEYELQRYVDKEFERIFSTLISDLKNNFNITKKSSELMKRISNSNLKNYIEDLANNKSKGNTIDKDEFLHSVSSLEIQEIPDYEERKFEFLKHDYENKTSIIRKILEMENDYVKKNEKIREVEEHDEAIKILNRFSYKDECIVCDNEIDTINLLSFKESNKEKIYESLDEDTKIILEGIIKLLNGEDPFNIERLLVEAIKNGDKRLVVSLKEEINKYFSIFNIKVNNLFSNSLISSDLFEKNIEYKNMIKCKPELTDEDILFIEKMVSENIEKDIVLKRDENNNLKLVLGEKEFLNQDRKDLHLSNGEQNFISLSFELLKAKNSSKKIIVLDDPISSFDSIYKNKIAYSIIRFLEGKKQIVLTHNTDLIKLMEHQKQKCFNLYLFNNTINEENGFIKVNNKEQEILLYIDKLLNLFRKEIFDEINNEKQFLISMIPFMRGYAQIINSKNEKDKLTKLMHGYQDEMVNLTEVYNNLFDKECNIKTSYKISAKDISNIVIENVQILKDDSQYPLLNKTLRHTLTYLYLRLNVEKVLVVYGNLKM